MQIVWSGGPNAWIANSHFHKVTTDNHNIDVDHVKSSNYYSYEVTFVKVGKTIITLKVGNKKLSSLESPKTSRLLVTVICGEPDKISLRLEDQMATCLTMALATDPEVTFATSIYDSRQ